MQATVIWFNRTRGYGFAKAEGIQSDVLLHQSVIKMDGFRFLKPGQVITIEGLEETDNGMRALKIIPAE